MKAFMRIVRSIYPFVLITTVVVMLIGCGRSTMMMNHSVVYRTQIDSVTTVDSSMTVFMDLSLAGAEEINAGTKAVNTTLTNLDNSNTPEEKDYRTATLMGAKDLNMQVDVVQITDGRYGFGYAGHRIGSDEELEAKINRMKFKKEQESKQKEK